MIGWWTDKLETLDQARSRISDAFADDEQYALFDDYVDQQQELIQAAMDRYAADGTFSLGSWSF